MSSYFDCFTKPLWVYVTVASGARFDATITEDNLVVGHVGSVKPLCPQDFVKMALAIDCPDEKDSMRHFYIGQGSWADESLYTIWKRLPAYVNRVGLSEDQEDTYKSLQFLNRPYLNISVKGFNAIIKYRSYGDELGLFSYNGGERLAASTVVSLITGRPVTQEQAFEMLVVDDGYGQTLAAKMATADTATASDTAAVSDAVEGLLLLKEYCPIDMDLVEFRAAQLAARMVEIKATITIATTTATATTISPA